MEADGALSLFKRSQSKLGLTHKTYIGDGDGKSYSTVAKTMPYGPLVHIARRNVLLISLNKYGQDSVKL